jgi:hypothetical protein
VNGGQKPIAASLIVFTLPILFAAHCTARPECGTQRALTPLPTVRQPGEEMSLTIVSDNNYGVGRVIVLIP